MECGRETEKEFRVIAVFAAIDKGDVRSLKERMGCRAGFDGKGHDVGIESPALSLSRLP